MTRNAGKIPQVYYCCNLDIQLAKRLQSTDELARHRIQVDISFSQCNEPCVHVTFTA